MKIFFIVLKVVAALAAIAAAIYVVLNHGEEIIAWFKRLLKLEPEEFHYFETEEELEEEAEEAVAAEDFEE